MVRDDTAAFQTQAATSGCPERFTVKRLDHLVGPNEMSGSIEAGSIHRLQRTTARVAKVREL